MEFLDWDIQLVILLDLNENLITTNIRHTKAVVIH